MIKQRSMHIILILGGNSVELGEAKRHLAYIHLNNCQYFEAVQVGWAIIMVDLWLKMMIEDDDWRWWLNMVRKDDDWGSGVDDLLLIDSARHPKP